jgi:hypothetical protein
MSVRLSFRMENLYINWADFHKIWHLSIFREYVEEIQVSLKSAKNKEYFTLAPMHICDNNLVEFFSEWEMFRTNMAQKIITYFMFNKDLFFFWKS